MDGQVKFTETKNIRSAIFFGAFAVINSCLTVFLIRSALKDTYPDLLGLAIGLFFGCGVLLFLWILWRFNTLKFYDDHVEIFSVFGFQRQTILLNDIKAWAETDESNDGKKWKRLTLYTDPGSFSITSTKLPEYDGIKQFLTTGRPEENRAVKGWWQINTGKFAYPLMAAGVLLRYLAYVSFEYCRKPVLAADLTTITYSVETRPRYSQGKGAVDIILEVPKYPEFHFAVPEALMTNQQRWSFMDSIRHHDTVSIDIAIDEYQKKLGKTKPVDILDMGTNFRWINVYGLKLKGKSYSSLEPYNRKVLKGNLMVVPLFSGMLGLLCLLWGYIYRRNARKHSPA